MANYDDNDYVFIIRTVQSAPIRTLIEALKEMLTDCNIEIDKKGIRIQEVTRSCAVLVHLELNADSFGWDKYYVREPKTLGISMINLFKIIKTMSPNDTLTLYMENNENKLGIDIHSGEKNQKKSYKLNLMYLPNQKAEILPLKYDRILTWVSSDFQKTCRDMQSLDFKTVDIQSANGQLIIKGESQVVSQETIIGDNSGNGGSMSYNSNNNPDEVVQGRFNLEYLVQFTKCSSLSQNVELYLQNNSPLIVRYKISDLGEVKFCVGQRDLDDYDE
jgi:proliferating cell nuclear antigen